MSSFSWPSTTGGSSSNASIGPTGSTAPSSATEAAGVNPSGNLIPLQLDANNNLLVAFGSTVEPIPVAQSGTWNITNITGTVSLPTGAATSALQTSGNTTLSTMSTTLGSILLDLTNGTQITQVSNFPSTQPISGTVAATQSGTWTIAATQSGTWNITNISGTISLPTGAATSANQTNGTQLTGLVAGTALVGKFGIDQTTPGTTNGVQVNAALPAGTNNIGKVTSLAGTPAALTVTNAAITVGTSAVRLTVSGSAPASTRVALVATPDTATATTVTFYIGASTVTNSGATRGIEIQVGQPFIANNDAGDYWIVASVAAQTVGVMEQA